MSSSHGDDPATRAAPAPREAAARRHSPADRFNIDREGPAKRALKLRELQEQFDKLNDYCNEAAAEIRASLARRPRERGKSER
jgi:hypothetical protein